MDPFITNLLKYLPVVGLIMMFKDQGQQELDAKRKYYDIVFPVEMPQEKIEEFIRSIGNNLLGGSTWRGVPSISFETWASPQGISHRIRIPEHKSIYLITQLQGALSGIEVNEIKDVDATGFQVGTTLHMANSAEELPVASIKGLSNRVLRVLQNAVMEHDTVVIQWNVVYSKNQKMPPSDEPVRSARRGGVLPALLGVGVKPAGHDELYSRRQKQVDQNFLAVGRVAARSETVERAQHLAGLVVQAYVSEGGSSYFYDKITKSQTITAEILRGATPLVLTAQLNVAELTGVISWPIGDEYFPGLRRGSTRHMPAPESVPRQGRVLGKSTMPGLDRIIAMSYEADRPGGTSPAVSHLFIAGRTGVGKTVLTENLGKQDIEYGAGLIVVERDGNLFNKLLNQVPPHRMKDVICVDLSRSDRPVGLNLLKLNKPEIIAGQLANLLDALYPDMKSLYANQLVRHGVPVLAELPRATIADLLTLVHPQNPAEKAWVRLVISQMKDRTYKDYWENWHKQDDKKIATDSQAFKNRMWELLTPEPTRYLLNQETSSFDPADVISGNKLLFVNLAGISEQAASLIGTMIVTSIWTAAKGQKPDKPNFLYLDEFQQFSHLSSEFTDMLATARKRNLGLVMATQYIESLKPDLQDAVMSNARSKVVFESSIKSATPIARDFANPHIRPESFVNLKAYDTIARINTWSGVSEPITMHTFAEPVGYNRGREILELSAQTYGRSVAQIEQEDKTRRVALTSPAPVVRKDIGRSSYDAPERN